MKSSPVFRRVALACIFVTAAASHAQTLPAPGSGPEDEPGAQIIWGSDSFQTNLMADGETTFEDSGGLIRFELGTFAPGFDPTTASPEQWVTSWIVLQGTDYDLDESSFVEMATLASNDSPFAMNGQAYIWGYDTKNLENGAQWILMAADAWRWPGYSSDALPEFPAEFFVSHVLKETEMLLGSVNGVTEDGVKYHMRMAWVEPVLVPEPSSVLLAMAGAAVGLLRRRRRD